MAKTRPRVVEKIVPPRPLRKVVIVLEVLTDCNDIRLLNRPHMYDVRCHALREKSSAHGHVYGQSVIKVEKAKARLM